MGDSITNGAGCGSGTVVNNPVNVVISSGGGGTTIGNVSVQNTLTVTTAFTSQGTASFVNLNAQYLIGDGSNISSLNASNITSGTLDSSHLQPSGVTAQLYGGVSNVPQLTIDQWGRVTAATNAQTQWTPTSLFNIATANAVSIGTLSDPPTGSNLYVQGTANVDTMNVNNLFANIVGLNTLNVYGTSNMNAVYASNYYGNASRLSNISGSSISGNVANSNVALVVSQAAQPNITSVGVLSNLTVTGFITSSNGYGISNLNASNLTGNVANSNVALVVSQGAQPNITSVGTLTGLNVQGLLIASNGSGISNINGANVTGNVANSTVALVVSQGVQPNITSVGTLTGLKVQGLLIASDGSGIASINGANVTGNVANSNVALVVSGGAQPNITSVGTLTGLNVQGLLIASDGSGIASINGANVSGNVANSTLALVVSGGAQPNITSLGTLSNLTVTGFITSSNGYGISNLNASNLTGNVANSNVALVVSQGAQPNITSVGTLTGLNVQGLLIASDGSGIASINGANVTGNVANSNVALVVSGGAQPNITSVGTLTSLAVTGILSAGLFTGNGSALSNLQASNIIGSFPLADSVRLPAQPNITSVGLLSNLAVSNSVTTGNVWANSLSVTALSGQNPVKFVSDSGSFLMTNTGRIGINLINPTSQLEIYQSGASSVAINLSDTIVGPGGGISLTKDSSQNMILENKSLADSLINNYSTTRLRMYATSGQALVGPVYIGPTILPSPSQTTALYTLGNAYVSNSVTTTNIYANQAYFSGITLSGTMSASGFSGTNFTGTNFNITTGGNITIGGSLATSGYYLQTTGSTVQWAAAAAVSTTFTGTAFNGGTFQGTTFTASTGFTGAAYTGGTFQGTTMTASTGFTGAAFSGGSFQGSTMSGTTITASTGFTGTAFTGGSFQGSTVTATGFTGTAFTGGTFQGTIVTASTGFTGAAYTGGTFYGTSLNTASANLTTANLLNLNVYTSANIFTANLVSANIANIFTTNIVGFVGSQWTSLGATSIYYINPVGIGSSSAPTANLVVTGNLYVTQNITTPAANVTTANVSTLNTASANLTTGNVGTLIVSQLANVTSLNVSSTANVTNLSVSSNIVPAGISGNTYLTGNIIVSGNVYTSIGAPLGAGGGYYFSLPSDIATQTPYTGAIYGTTYPLSVGLSNGFTINGTSTLISVTTNGNFKFVVGGAYKISAVFNGSDNITGLALGLSSTDVHGTDQGYLYRYTTQITQNPTELIEIPFNVSDVSKYYYLDLFLTASGTLKATTSSSGGTYLTITPLQGGGLATGGPGGTPGTQWISSGSNIYFPNAIGVGGAPAPGYNLDVSGDVRATGNVYSANPVLSGRTTSYSVGVLDYYIGINGTSVTATLPLGSSVPLGKTYFIKDESGNALINNITIAATSPNTIDGSASVIINRNYMALQVIWSGSFWSII